MEPKKSNMIELAMKHKQIAIIITSVLFCFGLFALMVMPRNEFPEFTIRQGLVVGIYPGATSEQVEEQLTQTVEEYLFGFKEVNREKTYSISKEGMLIVFVEVNNNVDDPDAFWDKIKFGLQNLQAQLPSQVLALIANNDFGDTAAVLLTVESKSKNKKQLEKNLKIIETELRKLEKVSKVRHAGLQNEQISIHFNQDKLARYGVNMATVLAAMQLESAVYYAGEIDNGELITPIHIPTSFKSENEIRNQIVYADPLGNLIRVKDVAEVKRTFEKVDSYIQNNGASCLLVALEMQTGNNIVEFGEDVNQALAKIKTLIPEDISIHKIADMPTAVDHSIQHFLKEFFIAIVAVILITMLFLPFRVAAVAGVTIPISIFISIGILMSIGVDLHTVSLAGLIVVLGMVVDNAIVVIDNYVEKLDEGIDHWNAAVLSAQELFIPVFSATLCIVATYVPMPIFMSGQTGDFVGSLPVTIGLALGVSLIVAVFLVPFMCYFFIKEGVHNEEKTSKFSPLDLLQKAYDTTLALAFKLPFWVILGGIVSVVVGGYIMTLVPRQLFPKVERNQFAVEIYLPKGSTLEQTAFVADSLSNMLMADARVENVATFIGESSPRFHTTYAPNFPAKEFAQLIVNTATNEDAIELLDEYEKQHRNRFPNAYVRMKQLDMLATRAPIEVRISGDDIEDLQLRAAEVLAVMEAQEDIIWARTDYVEPQQGLRIDIDDERANRLGLTRATIAASVAAGFTGIPVGTIWEGDYPVQVKIVNTPENKDDFTDLKNQIVTSPFLPTPVPLRQVASLTTDWSEGEIIRRNGVRTITVRADVSRDELPYKVLAKVKNGMADIIAAHPNLSFEYGGEEEEEIANYIPIGKSFGLGIVLIFFVLLFQFKTLRHALLIMTTMPLSILGAALGIFITGYAFGMTASLGLMSLMGIVVRNGIILVDYAEELRHKHGMRVAEAAVAAGKRRMRPIFLTSFAAAIGVVPMIVSGSTLWGPLGAVVCFGLLVSMALTLYVLPVLYLQFFKGKEVSLDA